MEFVQDQKLTEALQRLKNNTDFNYLLQCLGRDAVILMEQLVYTEDREKAGVLKHFLLPFLNHCGSLEYRNRNIVEEKRKLSQIQWNNHSSGFQYTDRDV